MSKRAEEAALEAYPHYTAENITEVTNARHFFEKGYETAEKETIERAVAWLEENVWEHTGLDHTELSDAFRQAMGQEPKNYRVRFVDMQVGFYPAITWQDIKKIVEIADDLDPLYNPDALDAELQTEEAFYKEVLKRFEEGRK